MTFIPADMTPQQRVDRLESLKKKLKARTRPDGSPIKNFEQNVAALKDEIDELESYK